MIVKFKNPHPGVGGPVEPLPRNLTDYINQAPKWDAGELKIVVANIAEMAPGYWVSIDDEDLCIRLLRRDDDLDHAWKLIEFEEVGE